MDFMAEARADELRVQRIFAACDTNGDGFLDVAEYTEFLVRVEYVPPGSVLDEDQWAMERSNLGASSPEGISFEQFRALYTTFGRSVQLDFESVVPADQPQLDPAGSSSSSSEGQGGATQEAAAAATAVEATGKATKLQKTVTSVAEIAQLLQERPAPAAGDPASTLEHGAFVQNALGVLSGHQAEVLKMSKKAAEKDPAQQVYGAKTAATILKLQVDLQAAIELATGCVESCTVACEEAEAALAAVARAEADEQAAAEVGAAAAAAAAADETRRVEEEAVAAAAASNAERRAAEAELHARAEAVRREKGQAPLGRGDDFSANKWKSVRTHTLLMVAACSVSEWGGLAVAIGAGSEGRARHGSGSQVAGGHRPAESPSRGGARANGGGCGARKEAPLPRCPGDVLRQLAPGASCQGVSADPATQPTVPS